MINHNLTQREQEVLKLVAQAKTNKEYYNQKIKTEELKKALQEIRDIAKEQLQDVSNRCINTTPMYIVHKHIIDKINEVIGAE